MQILRYFWGKSRFDLFRISNMSICTQLCHFFGFDGRIWFRLHKFLVIADAQMSRNMRKPTMWILSTSDTNQAVQPLEMARGLKFCIKEVEALSIQVAKTKALISFAVTRFVYLLSGRNRLYFIVSHSRR